MKTIEFDVSKYGFRNLVSDLFHVDELENIHEIRKDLLPTESLNLYTESSTKFHNIFYSKLNDNWTSFYDLYDNFIHTEVTKLFSEPFHYQKWPTFRVHIPNDQAIHTFHSDGDPLHKHPPGEINFFLPLTRCYGTNTMWVESEPMKLDFKPIELQYGKYSMFNGNQCMHGNKPNKTSLTRISFDFRVIPLSKYNPSWETLSATSNTKFSLGHYYTHLK
tara:strand:- start:40 stop:696 length:657 start_codon:yes stop_codon:yes gene_type:complete